MYSRIHVMASGDRLQNFNIAQSEERVESYEVIPKAAICIPG